jgi:hypothetical protein
MAKKDTFSKWVEDGEADSMLAVIQSLSMQGFSQVQIAKEVGITDTTLRLMAKRYPSVSSALKNGRRTVVALAQNKLMDKVQMGDTTAIIYALKVYGGEFFNSDRLQVKAEVTGRNGQPINVDMGPQIYLPQKDEEGEDGDE